jgi:hypothetical protein
MNKKILYINIFKSKYIIKEEKKIGLAEMKRFNKLSVGGQEYQ